MNELPAYTKAQDALPTYEPSLQLYGLALLKTEFLTPYHYNTGKRTWRPVVLELNSTQLNMYQLNVSSGLEQLVMALFHHQNQLLELALNVKNDHKPDELLVMEQFDELFAGDAYGGDVPQDVFSMTKSEKLRYKLTQKRHARAISNIAAYSHDIADNHMLFEPVTSAVAFTKFKAAYCGAIVHSYTLDNINVGEAPSLNHLISALYKEDKHPTNASTLVKYKNCLRLRIECKQVLLQLWSFYAMVQWYRNLNIGCDLCKPVDSRNITKLKSIPSRYSSRNNALLAATAAAASYLPHPSPPEPETDWIRMAPDKLDCVSHTLSLFSRRGSVGSQDSSIHLVSIPSHTVTINKQKLVLYESYYTTIEKQYISNCIPNLNSFDRWSGRDLTLLAFNLYAPTTVKPLAAGDDIFISCDALLDSVHAVQRKRAQRLGECRRFLIHENGLVSVNV